MFYVYILASIRRTLYIGVTSDLRRRVFQHKTGAIEGFTARYRVNRLVYFEVAESAEGAIKREKQLEGLGAAPENGTHRGGKSRMGGSVRSHRVG